MSTVLPERKENSSKIVSNVKLRSTGHRIQESEDRRQKTDHRGRRSEGGISNLGFVMWDVRGEIRFTVHPLPFTE